MGVLSTNKARWQGDSTVIPTFINATITEMINLQEMRHAGTKGGPQRLSGVKDWNGTWEELALVPTFWPGDEVTFYGSLNGALGYTGDALVTGVTINIPVATKAPPKVTGTFRGIAALDDTDDTTVAIPAAATPPSVEGICVQLQPIDGGEFANQAGTSDITITLTIEDQPFHDCGSSGVMDAIEGNWDANISYSRYVDDPTDLPNPGDAHSVRVPIDALGTQYYQFNYMRVGDISGITFDRAAGALFLPTIPLMMSMIETVNSTVTVGAGVTKPDTNIWRPTET